MSNTTKKHDNGAFIAMLVGAFSAMVIGGLWFLGAFWGSSSDKTVFHSLAREVSTETSVVILCCSGLAFVLICTGWIIMGELRKQSELTRQLLRAYGHEPEV